jgi:arylsulfatase
MRAVTPSIGLFAKLTGAPVPQDRLIDGVDQNDFLLGKKEPSNREGILTSRR